MDQLLEGAIMKYFYQFMLLWAQFDLAIAKSTGRNPANVEQLQKEEERWSREVLLADLNL